MPHLNAEEAPRDHASLDKALKKLNKKYYTDELLGVLTLNDKRYAYSELNAVDEDNGNDYEEADQSGYILNPVEIDGEIRSFIDPQFPAPVGPVASEEEIEARETPVDIEEVSDVVEEVVEEEVASDEA